MLQFLPMLLEALPAIGEALGGAGASGGAAAGGAESVGGASKVLSGLFGNAKDLAGGGGGGATSVNSTGEALSHAVSLQNIQKIQRMGESPIPMGNANLPGQGVMPSELQPKLGDLKEQLQGIVSADLKGGFVGLAKIVPDCAKAIERFGTQVVEASRHLAQFSPQITYAMAQMDRQRMLQERDMARQTGGSTAFATKELMGLREQMQPMQQLSANVKNLASGIFSATAEKAMWLLNAVIKPLNEVVKWFGELLGGSDKDVRAPFEIMLGHMLDESWTKGPKSRRPKVD